MENTENLKNIKEALKNDFIGGDELVFFGGAGVSTESGIPDFRSSSGLYSEKYGSVSPEVIVSHDYFFRNTSLFYDFFFEKLYYPDAVPNCTHTALANAERAGGRISVVTQNIDGLHQKAGSSTVFELHGNVCRLVCTACHDVAPTHDFAPGSVPHCKKCGGLLKPDVVLYGEGLDDETVNGALSAISRAKVLIVAGTSLAVMPAAGMVRYFSGERIYIINKTPLPIPADRGVVQLNVALSDIFGDMSF